jgi:O-antigen chain-terminating methyltransferase
MFKPYAHYQHEVDTVVAEYLAYQEQLSLRHSHQISRVENLVKELIATSESLRRSLRDQGDHLSARAEQAVAQSRETWEMLHTLHDQLNALPETHCVRFEPFEAAVGDVVGYRSVSLTSESSAYVVFESVFRGPEEQVAETQRPYVRLVTDHQPVLDVGCGRGEFIALLESEQIESWGVDNDAGMVEHCRARGLPVTLTDANERLASIDDATLGTVFSAQVIEHLSVDEFRRLLELSRRKLKPGGLFIAETINPHHMPSLKTFHVDLTRHKPVFPEAALMFCAIADFEEAYVFAPGYRSYEQARLDSPTYAVIATVGRERGDH